jgi:CrcB protein
MTQLIAIALGGSVGAVARFLIANGVYAWLGRGFPHGTLFVNVSGSFLMGLLTELLLQRFAVAVEYRAAVLVGFLGAYTTFSTFALESFALIEAGSFLKAFLNILLSTVLCILAVWIGMLWGRTLFAGESLPWTLQGQAYTVLILGWIAVFMVTFCLTLTFHFFEWPLVAHRLTLIVLLSLATLTATLWMAFKLTDIPLELGGLFSVFILNGLCAAPVIWLASHLGSWLWHLYPSR